MNAIQNVQAIVKILKQIDAMDILHSFKKLGVKEEKLEDFFKESVPRCISCTVCYGRADSVAGITITLQGVTKIVWRSSDVPHNYRGDEESFVSFEAWIGRAYYAQHYFEG